MKKRLIINADDYGISREVNDAIETLVTDGRLRNVSVIANSWFYNDAAAFLQQHPECCTGAHLNAVEGIAVSPTEKIRPLIGEHGQLVSREQLFRRWLVSPWAVAAAVETEWRAQIELLLTDGIRILHADSHQHIHAFPPFWRIAARLCREYGIPAIRFPAERNSLPLRRSAALALRHSANIASLFYGTDGLALNDHFLGFKRAGNCGEAEMIHDISRLADGTTELVCHPSLYADVPYTGYRGDMEYKALLGTAVWQRIADESVELVTWASLAGK